MRPRLNQGGASGARRKGWSRSDDGQPVYHGESEQCLDLTGAKIGSKQTFTLVDITGGELADGHEVRIRYTPHTGKPSYWLETKGVITPGSRRRCLQDQTRGHEGRADAPTGKFVAPPPVPNALGVSDKQQGALLVDIIDPARKVSILKATDQPAPAPSDTAPPASTPPPAPEKPEAAP